MKIQNKYHIKRAFTLLELLITIGIIALLVTGGIVSYSTLSKNGRDARRKADVEQLRSALEMYKSNDANASYPGIYDVPNTTSGWSYFKDVQTAFKSYINKVPSDPKPPDPAPIGSCNDYLYAVDATYKKYTIYTYLENTSSTDATSVKPTPAAPPSGSSSDGYKTFKVTNGVCINTTFNYWVNNP